VAKRFNLTGKRSNYHHSPTTCDVVRSGGETPPLQEGATWSSGKNTAPKLDEIATL
jgi:hypothetical protein